RNKNIGNNSGSGNINLPNHVLKYFARLNEPLDFQTAYAVGVFAMYPFYPQLREDPHLNVDFGITEIAKVQAVALLSSIYNLATNQKEGAHLQLAGIVSAVFDYDISFSSHGMINVGSKSVYDNCGMGGDTTNTFHISTSAALIAASQGLHIGKHGSSGNAQRSGSSDFVISLGIKNDAEPKSISKSIDEANFGYIEAIDQRYKRIHVQTHDVAHLAHMNDIIGPMTNPLNPRNLTGKLLGVNQVISPEVVAKAYVVLNALGVTNIRKGMVVRGYNVNGKTRTLDEISTMNGGTDAVLINGDELTMMHLTYRDFGFGRASYEEEISPKVNDKGDRIKYTMKVLRGDATEGSKNILVANAATLLALSEMKRGSEDLGLKEKVDIAERAIKEGAPFNVISQVKEIQAKFR
ncbi:MAG: hypothetical protein KGH71_04325, partial [Candidatus Micrarchaeota archaeon]|nr:hypothetical protein [Candidatus Micrarchaeota archaeon]